MLTINHELKNRITSRLVAKTLSRLVQGYIECPACGEPVSSADGQFKPIADTTGRDIAWFLFHRPCIQPETDVALQAVFDDVFVIETPDGPVTVEIASELSSHEPIATSRCIACGRPAAWMESDRILTELGEIWIHWSCKR